MMIERMVAHLSNVSNKYVIVDLSGRDIFARIGSERHDILHFVHFRAAGVGLDKLAGVAQ